MNEVRLSVRIRRMEVWRHREVCHEQAAEQEDGGVSALYAKTGWKVDVEKGWGPGNDLVKETLLPDVWNIIARY